MLKIKAIVFTVGYSSFRQRATMAALPEKWLVFKLFYTVFKPLLLQQIVVNLERINTKFRSNGGTQYRPDRSCTSSSTYVCFWFRGEIVMQLFIKPHNDRIRTTIQKNKFWVVSNYSIFHVIQIISRFHGLKAN